MLRLLSRLLVLGCFASLALDTFAQTQALSSVATPSVHDTRRVFSAPRTESIELDGRLEEAIWRQAPVINEFTQRVPDEGQPPTARTDVWILYDADALFIGARMHDNAPDSIVARLGRRDADLDADHFVVFIDPFYDRRSGYYFGINAAGTLYDGVLMNDEWDDDSWDGVWQGRASIDESGWSMEMRIPYSQLRFYKRDDYVWGINFRRGITRRNEQDVLVYVPSDESGFVSRFYELVGMKDIRPRRQVEFLPYSTMRAEFTDQPAGNPFNDGSRYVPGIGADFKVGVTSNLTLNGTINPDFGQVEVDPAVVNLSDVETFFPERRPFFIEGASVFNFGQGGANNNWGFNWGNPFFFYSRRIGRAPQGSLPAHDYAQMRDGTRILGATKLTGRVGKGWNVGTIQAVTEREMADYTLDGIESNAEVEPLAYYGVFRGQREFNDGRQALGFLGTAAARDFREERLRAQMNDRAYFGGLDGWTFLGPEKTWVVTGWLGLSQVRGTQDQILNLQQSSLHYFQRPDAKYTQVDSAATALTGMAGRFALNKQRGNFTINTAVGFISPGFDVNDMGFLWRTNVINTHFVASYLWNEPTNLYQRMRNNLSVFRSYDFDGNVTWTGVWWGNFVQFLDFSSVFFMVAVNPETVNNRGTRGGPLMINPPGAEVGFEYSSDSRKRWMFDINSFSYLQKGQGNYNAGIGFTWQPLSNMSLRLGPELNVNKELAQYVGAFDDPLATTTFGRRYVFAALDQVTLSSSIRLNWTFSPELSFQLFAQPLISSGDYFAYKELRRPKSFDFVTYGEEGSTFDAETRTADPDGDGPADAIALPNQDFNFKSLRGTAVLRWEFSPGSTLFLVWTQRRSDFEDQGQFNFRPSLDRLFEAKPDNIFMVKVSYWLSR